ncbi:MAG TPA: class I adenylate-forming enzyme family protein [Acidimicrobiales bacterium]
MMLLEMASSGFGDRVALGPRDGSGLTYQELFNRAGAAAAFFEGAGIERVTLVDVSSPALPIALFGAAWAGKPFAPLNYRLTAEELRRLAQQVAPTVTVCEDQAQPKLFDLPGVQPVRREEFLSAITDANVRAPEWGMDPDEVAILLFTSGTTGAPKAAVLRHKHLVSYIFGSVEFMGADEDEATLISVPPYHIAGMAAILSSVYAGRRIVQLPTFDAAAWVELVQKERVTHAMVVPTMLARIVDHLVSEGIRSLPTLRSISYGGGKMPQSVIEQALDLLPNADFVNAYGLTETSSTICILGPEEHRAARASDDPAVRRRLTSVGKPLPTVELSIRDEDGREVPPGERGEIWVRGEQVSGEYLGKGSQVNADGWFPTKDGGYVDEEGYLYLEGRIDDIIIRGGENISPGEIEETLLAHPAVADAAAIGLPSRQWGETVGAVVVKAKGAEVSEDELRDWVTSHLRSSRTPEHIVFRDELPYNDMGKLLRRVLKAELASLGDTDG